ncbi:MAG: bifunctional folylpolyglutamate synthase/dihydrofolate synthase [Legionella sp.]|jgi:dihydrofolate synthase/folylpolyglutamate synthase|nr:bifunctional folylpolyglutamate synthase/dihydrofolate synthase [Legionella sp.]
MTTYKAFSLQEWLTYIETRHREPIQLGLPRIQAFAKALDVLIWDKTVVITVGGTNGKGSTVASLQAIYSAAGFSVATYISPHLLTFNERIQINQTPISDQALCEAFLAIHELDGSSALTYFEMTTLAALVFFKAHQPDVLLLEVGMGGRLDATNIIDSDLAIVTTVDLDHQAWLGDTVEAIGYEKAGIFRANKPAIYADTHPPSSLVNHANQLHTSLLCLNQDYFIEHNKHRFLLKDKAQVAYELPALSIHPKAFAAAMMASLTLQNRLFVPDEAYQKAAKTITLSGRQEWLKTRVPTLVDVSHNPQSIHLLAEYVKSHAIQGKVHAVFSGLQGRVLSSLIEPMKHVVDIWYLSLLDDKRGVSKTHLKQAYTDVMNQEALPVFNTPLAAYQAAVFEAQPGDVIIVYGSFVLVSAIMHAYLNEEI